MSTVAGTAFSAGVNGARTPRIFEESYLVARKSGGEPYGCGTASVAASEIF